MDHVKTEKVATWSEPCGQCGHCHGNLVAETKEAVCMIERD